MLQIILTITIVVVVMLAIIKKFHPTSVIFAVSIISMLLYTLFTGNSVLGDKTTGSQFLDVFELVINTTKTQIAGNVLMCILFVGYISYMDTLQANDLFAVYIGKALTVIKQKYLLTAMLVVVVAFMKLFLGSAIAVVMVLLSVLYPALRKAGCTNETICSSHLLGTIITWGPTDGGVVATPGLAGVEYGASEFFMDYQFIPCVITLLVMAVVSYFTSIYFDKKEAGKKDAVDSVSGLKDMSTITCPKYYAILPVLPMALIFLLGGRALPVSITTHAALLLSLAISLTVHLLSNLKRFRDAFNEIKGFYQGMGKAVTEYAFIIVAGSFLATTINTVGGMKALVVAIQNMGGGATLLTIIGGVLACIVTGLTVSYLANLNTFVPFLATIAEVTGGNVLRLAQIANNCCGLGTGLTIAGNAILFMSGMCKTDPVTVIKRNALPIFAGLVTMLTVSLILG